MFKIKNLKEIKKILDIKITRNRKKRTLRINQIYYLNEMFDKFHINIDKHEFIKLFINNYNVFRSIESKNERINSKNYQHKMNKLIYIAIHIRSNIFFMKRFNQYFNNFAKHHDQTLKTLFKYIRFIINFDMIYD